MISVIEDPVALYKTTGQSDMLVEKYANFLNKYCNMFYTGNIDFTNYDIRCFLSLYISNERITTLLRRGKFLTSEVVSEASRVLHMLKSKLASFNRDDIFYELLIPFLKLALKYKDIGAGFQRYLYHAYRYDLKRHLDMMPFETFDPNNAMYWQALDAKIEKDKIKGTIEMDELFEFSRPEWIHGNDAQEPFSLFEPHERYILVKYYHEKKQDKEIARMLPYHPKSISRIRNRCINKIKDLQTKGELKCLRFVKSRLLQ